MKRELTKKNPGLYHIDMSGFLYHIDMSGFLLLGAHERLTGDLSNLQIFGNCSNIFGEIHPCLIGDVSGLSGDISGVYGDATYIRGNLTNCETNDQIVNINHLVQQ